MATRGLLYVYSDPLDGINENQFHSWYENHVQERLGVSGIGPAHRFKNADGKKPAYLAIYELEDINILESYEYKTLKVADPELDALMLSKIVFDRRIYALTKQWGSLEGTPELLQPNCMTPGKENEADQEAWYEQEHIPIFQQIKGWQMTRRYKLVDRHINVHGKITIQEGPDWMTVHWWAKNSDLGGEKRKEAAKTPWTEKVRGYMQFHEGPRMFEHI